MRLCGSWLSRVSYSNFTPLALTVLISGVLGAPMLATTIVAPTDGQLVDESSVIVSGSVLSSETIDRDGELFTDTRVQVDSTLRGSADRIVIVRHPGGRTESRVRVVFGAPEFVPGERVLLFLNPAADRLYTTNGLFIGKFSERKTKDGGRVWYRSNEASGTTLLDSGLQHSRSKGDVQRRAGGFETFVRDRAEGRTGSPEYFVVNPQLELRESASFATMAESDIHRWFRFDDGASVEWSSVGGQAGFDRGGVPEFEKALGVWSSYPGARVRFSNRGPVTQTAKASVQNGINEILFNDPFGEIFGRWNGQSGVLAQAEYHAVKVNRSWNAPFDAGQSHPAKTFPEVWEIVEGNIIIQEGVSPFYRIGDVMLTQIIAHEVGHTLGLAHSRDSAALMSSTIDGTGAFLREDDQLAVRWLYPVTPGATPGPAPELTPVTVDFTVSKEYAEVSEALQLVDLSTGSPIAWEWSFGDGRNSNEKNPVHRYESPGTYLVTLSASNGSNASSRSRSVLVTTEQQIHSLVPVATQAGGAGGTQWRTELALFNTGMETTQLTLVYLPQTGDHSVSRSVMLSGGESVTWDNALPELFGVEAGMGAIEIASSDAETVRVSSRTFTGEEAGTYGQSVPQMFSPEALNYITGIHSNSSFRTNVGLVNRSLNSLSAELSLLTSEGTVVGVKRLEIDARSFRQVPLTALFPTLESHDGALSLKIEASRGGALSSYASVVDNQSQDPFLVPATPSGPAYVIVPGVAHTPGAGGTFWRTDVTMFNPTIAPMEVELGLLGRNERRSVTIEPGLSLAVPDVVQWLEPGTGQGALEIRASGVSGPVISARTYTQSDTGATFGQWVQQSDPANWGTSASITGVKSNARFRSNAGIVNANEAGTWIELELIGGETPSSARIFLEGRSQTQIALQSWFPGTELTGATLIARSMENLPITLYGSVVDNLSGDPTYLSGR